MISLLGEDLVLKMPVAFDELIHSASLSIHGSHCLVQGSAAERDCRWGFREQFSDFHGWKPIAHGDEYALGFRVRGIFRFAASSSIKLAIGLRSNSVSG